MFSLGYPFLQGNWYLTGTPIFSPTLILSPMLSSEYVEAIMLCPSSNQQNGAGTLMKCLPSAKTTPAGGLFFLLASSRR